MKNFEMRCLIDGTSALQPAFEHAPSGTIIEFPANAANAPRSASQAASAPQEACQPCGSIGSSHRCAVEGQSFDRVRPWQAVLAGCVFSGCAFASVLLGL